MDMPGKQERQVIDKKALQLYSKVHELDSANRMFTFGSPITTAPSYAG